MTEIVLGFTITNDHMRTFMKDIIIICNTACIGGIAFYEYGRDSNASAIVGLAIFIVCMTLYLLLQAESKRRRRRY